MKASRPLAFVVLAFAVGATISQASFAFADDSSTNPFRAIWDAIGELQTRTDSLQSQIDDLKEIRKSNSNTAAEPVAASRISEPSVAIEVGSGQSGQTVIQVIARNAGPENAVGVKLSTYYQTSLFSVNFIQGAECTDQARGIIECYLGTLDVGSEARIAVDATPSALGQQAMITTDISSITEDANPANNHAEAVFITSEAPVVITPPTAQPEQIPAEQIPQEQVPPQQPSESQEEQQPGQEQPAEQQGEQSAPPEELPGEEANPLPEQGGEQAGAPSGGDSSTAPVEAPSSSGGESSGGASSEPAGGESSSSSPPPPPPAPPSGGEGPPS